MLLSFPSLVRRDRQLRRHVLPGTLDPAATYGLVLHHVCAPHSVRDEVLRLWALLPAVLCHGVRKFPCC